MNSLQLSASATPLLFNHPFVREEVEFSWCNVREISMTSVWSICRYAWRSIRSVCDDVYLKWHIIDSKIVFLSMTSYRLTGSLASYSTFTCSLCLHEFVLEIIMRISSTALESSTSSLRSMDWIQQLRMTPFGTVMTSTQVLSTQMTVITMCYKAVSVDFSSKFIALNHRYTIEQRL